MIHPSHLQLDPQRASAQPVGNTALSSFDALIIGSGAGGSSVAAMLTRHGLNVLVLEIGPNYFGGLDQADPRALKSSFSNDILGAGRRGLTMHDGLRTFRKTEQDAVELGDVNLLPQTLGGGAVYADLKTPRFAPQDFKLGAVRKDFPDTTFSDWPVDYDMLEPFYSELEKVIGVQGDPSFYPWEGKRSAPLPMIPGAPMYLGLKLKEAAEKLGYHPFPYPGAINSRPYDGRPACNDCGFCLNLGCATSAKGAPPVTTLRQALLTGRCLVLPETKATRLLTNSTGTTITGVEAINPSGEKQIYRADRYVLAASPIESARLLFLSDPSGAGIGNSSGMVGRNLTFHLQNIASGICTERVHGHRGRTVSHGMADFRGEIGNPDRPLGGIIEFTGGWDPLFEALTYNQELKLKGTFLEQAMKESPLRDRLMVLVMQAEDAPQWSNRVDLDPSVRDADGLPVARVTYQNHRFELGARDHYLPKMIDLLGAAGAKYTFEVPLNASPQSRHILGTLRMGTDPKQSVCDPSGRFHDVGNLFAADGSLFPTSSGFNPTLTLMALAMRVGAEMVYPGSPERAL